MPVNLIGNARNAMEDVADESMQLTLRVAMDRGSLLRVSVEDQGEGISAENLTRVFAHGFTTRRGGDGLADSKPGRRHLLLHAAIRVRASVGKFAFGTKAVLSRAHLWLRPAVTGRVAAQAAGRQRPSRPR